MRAESSTSIGCVCWELPEVMGGTTTPIWGHSTCPLDALLLAMNGLSLPIYGGYEWLINSPLMVINGLLMGLLIAIIAIREPMHCH